MVTQVFYRIFAGGSSPVQLSILSEVGGAIVGGLPGALLGTALAYFIGGGLWWRELRTEIRARETVVAEESRRVAAGAPIASARNS